MAVNNSLAKKSEEMVTVRYEVNGAQVIISPTIIRNYLVNGDGNVSDQEIVLFMNLCKFQRLNPFLREAYLIKFGTSPATMVVGKEVFTKRANRNTAYDGHEAGIIVLDKDGNPVERTGTFKLPKEQIVGGWASVYKKDHKVPTKISVSIDEYIGRKKGGEINSQWSKKPATMIRKVALVQALREAFPEDFQGLYAAEESGVDDAVINTEPITIQSTEKPAFTEIEVVQPNDDPLA
jgi:phage recombination protein Bet